MRLSPTFLTKFGLYLKVAIGLVSASEREQFQLSCKRFKTLVPTNLFSTIYFKPFGCSCNLMTRLSPNRRFPRV